MTIHLPEYDSQKSDLPKRRDYIGAVAWLQAVRDKMAEPVIFALDAMANESILDMQVVQERIRPSADFRRMKARIELFEILAEADEDVNDGRVAPIEDTFTNLRAILREKGKII